MAKETKSSPRLNAKDISNDDPDQVFELLDVIGEGAFGLICTCKHLKQNNKIFAIKFLKIKDEASESDLQKEIDILKDVLNCSYTVRYYGCYMKDKILLIVMEYCDGGSVLDIIKATGKGLTEEQIGAICSHIVQVLVTSDGFAKLADFGVSAKLQNGGDKRDSIAGSPYWIAPEVVTISKDKPPGYNNKCDVWSLGITAIEFAEKQPPLYSLVNPHQVMFVIPKRDPPTLSNPTSWSKDFNDFLATCLKKDPEKRPSASELLNHPFIKKYTSKSNDIIKQLVTSTRADVERARAEAKAKREKQEEPKSSSFSSSKQYSTGTRVMINTRNGSVSFSYGTTMLVKNQSDSSFVVKP